MLETNYVDDNFEHLMIWLVLSLTSFLSPKHCLCMSNISEFQQKLSIVI